MRGVDTGGPRPRGARQAVITAGAVLTALGLSVSACGTGGTGARDEGPASGSVAGGAATTASPTGAAPPTSRQRVDAISLVRTDPEVSAAVKRDLKPCVGDEYPVDVSYGNLTGGSANDVVINVMTCGDAVGVGSYVYRENGGRYSNVFRAEEPPVYAEIDRGDLVVTQQVYEKGDSVAYPSGEEVITYRWAGGHFAEQARTRNDYSKVVGGGTPAPAEG
ncbi:hypothetical protein [Streptomyces fructofermentans]|uniref:Lipoprotein CseA n=1 Tax=Streptomyces fructofermentans TaxID=152141 RepID=A0A918KIH3_9ACTN|nr:hypothetical protein [Streptomyces fructofermentans]GGX64483.1 lipoprotein CseA [Streptomyces fructofermentans]